MKSIAIVGAGGMARDALVVLDALGLGGRVSGFYESDEVWSDRRIKGLPVCRLSSINVATQHVVVGIGDGLIRQKVVELLPSHAVFPTFMHPSVVRGRDVELDAGTIICAGTVLTTDITFGKHVLVNVGCTITHDCTLGDYATLSPGCRLSGNCSVGKRVFIGTAACLREKTTVVDDVVIGMGAVVVDSLTEAGTYIGCPARRRQ